MSEVKRYEMKTTYRGHESWDSLEEDKDGGYVNYEDYAALESKCVALAAENAGLNNFIASSCYVLAGEEAAWHPAIDHAPETPAINQLSIAESQFLTDVMTAAGLLSCGKRDTQLAKRLADFCVSKRGGSNPAQLRKGGDQK